MRGSHLQGHTFVPLLPPRRCRIKKKPILITSLCSPGKSQQPCFGSRWEEGRTFLFIFLPSPFILLQALIIEGLNLSCSCLLPSFLDNVSNKGLWFEFEGFFFFFTFSFPLQRSKACNEIPTPSPSYSPLNKPSAWPAPPSAKAPASPPMLPGEGGHPIPVQGCWPSQSVLGGEHDRVTRESSLQTASALMKQHFIISLSPKSFHSEKDLLLSKLICPFYLIP